MVKTRIHLAIVFICSCIFGNTAYSQDSCVYDDMSIEELLDVDVIVAASKKPEDLFEAPLSVTIIKKDDIIKAGCTSIMEALRLSSGLIVRESTPGNYDIHIRGFDDANKNFYVPVPFNSTILVMIDNRVVFSYFSGGTLWETLPVSIHDIDRIEVVRGPASALYGPNAVNGVINIITTNAKEQGLNSFASASSGSAGDRTFNASAGYNWDDNTRITVSANHVNRSRKDDKYYCWKNNLYVNQSDLQMFQVFMRDTVSRAIWSTKDFMDTLKSKFDEELGMQSSNCNVFLSHNFGYHSKIDLSVGGNISESQKPGSMNFITPHSQTRSHSAYIDSRLQIHNWSGQMNLIKGEDLSNFGFNSYEYNVFNASMEYNWQIWKKFNIRPGVNIRQVEYKSPVTNIATYDFSILNNEFEENEYRTVRNMAFFFLTEWKPTEKLRFIAGVRTDTFNLVETATSDYEIACTYRLNKNNMLRMVNSEAYRAPFIFDTYLNAKSEMDMNNSGVSFPFKEYYTTKDKLTYPSNNTFEIGWRCKLSGNIDFDIEFFTSKLSDLLVSINNINIVNYFDSAFSYINTKASGTLTAENYNTSAKQNGISFTINYKASDKLNIEFYSTIQKTEMSGAESNYTIKSDTSFSTDADTKISTMKINEMYNYSNWSPQSTPKLYGGLVINYKPYEKWNVNLSTYYYSKQIFKSNYGEQQNELKIDPWADINLKITYNPWSKLLMYASGNNLLGRHRELGGADNIGTTLWIGMQWGF